MNITADNNSLDVIVISFFTFHHVILKKKFLEVEYFSKIVH